MKKLGIVLMFVSMCVVAVASAKSDAKKLKAAGKFTVPPKNVGVLTVACDAEHGNLVYYAQAEAMGKNIGGTNFSLRQPESCSKKEGEQSWKVLGEYEIPNTSDTLTVWCDAERGNLVYLSLLHYAETNFGYDISVIHQPEACITPPDK